MVSAWARLSSYQSVSRRSSDPLVKVDVVPQIVVLQLICVTCAPGLPSSVLQPPLGSPETSFPHSGSKLASKRSAPDGHGQDWGVNSSTDRV